MPIVARKVKGAEYLYFRESDPETKERHEEYLGRKGERDTERRALLMQKEALLREIQTYQTRLTQLDSSLKDYGEGASLECHPFVKWAGGKTQLIDKIKKYLPEKFERYYEPFLGGGAVFFYLATSRPPFPATLSDVNRDLVNAYEAIRDDVEELIVDIAKRKEKFEAQKTLSDKNKLFQSVRSSPPEIDSEPIARAGWFIFLNKTAYNGLYRVNRNNDFNVPFGGYSKVSFFEAENLRRISTLLNRKEIALKWADYRQTLKSAKEGDFAYLDPPYYSPDNRGFTAYNASLFTADDQKKLADEFKRLTDKGVMVVLSNSKSDFIESEFKRRETKKTPLTYDTLEALRVINCKGSNRTGVKELLIKNF